MTLHASLEEVLAANPNKNCCADCLAQAVGLTSPQDRTPVTQLIRTTYIKYTDRVVEQSPCAAGCGKTSLVVTYKG